MRVARRLAHSPALEVLAAWLIAGLIMLVRVTGRWTVLGGDALNDRLERGEALIGCFWHGRLMMMPYLWRRGRRMNVLISHHRDGRLIARAIRHFALRTVRGSTSRGALAGSRELYGLLRAGESIAITPDGPRGPRMRAAPGVVRLAALTGVPILPAAFSTRRRRVLSSWDRFVVALPFTRGVFVIGDPITVPRDASPVAIEQARQDLESRLNVLSAEADRLTGHAPITPAPETGV